MAEGGFVRIVCKSNFPNESVCDPVICERNTGGPGGDCTMGNKDALDHYCRISVIGYTRQRSTNQAF